MTKSSQVDRLLLALLLGASFTTSACKFGQPASSLRAGESNAQMVLVHGERVPVATQNEILLALGETPTLPNKDPLNSENETLIAQNDPSTTGATTGGASTDDQLLGGESGSVLSLQGGGDPYIEKCKAAGVPIPPPWGDARWGKPVTTLTAGRIFALNPTYTTMLYSYRDPNVAGTCAALPRIKGTTIKALGIICQAASGSACFWDNVERTRTLNQFGEMEQAKISDPARIRPEEIANGDNLDENCSQCHRGSNVFILHHDDLQKLPGSDADSDYVPISDQGWSNPTMDEKIAPKCAECHNGKVKNKLGRLDATYCGTVMMPSIQSIQWRFDDPTQKWKKYDHHAGKKPPMPPEDEVDDVAAFVSDVAAIKAECKRATEAVGNLWTWNESKSP